MMRVEHADANAARDKKKIARWVARSPLIQAIMVCFANPSQG